MTVRDLIDRATQQRTALGAGSVAFPRAEYAFPDFREALLAVAGAGGAINGKSLGKWLALNQDRIVDGLCIERGKLRSGILRWRLRGIRRADTDGDAG